MVQLYAILNIQEDIEEYEQIQSYTEAEVIGYANGFVFNLEIEGNITALNLAIRQLKFHEHIVVPIIIDTEE
jgi:hypothetical protein